MKLSGICITTDNAARLVEFYSIVFQEKPVVDGSHYGFNNLAIWNPGDVKMSEEQNIWLQCFDTDIDELYKRLLQEIPDIKIISSPERKPWGAYSFWFADPDGNKIAVAQTIGQVNNTTDNNSELERVKAELAELKQRYGIDKQEAFLAAHANISLKEFAAMLHGRDCQPNLTQDELLLAQQRGFVVVYGDSDDRVEFEGALRAEGDTNPLAKDRPAGVLALSEDGELLNEDSELYAEYIKENRNAIKVFYCKKDGLNWAFESDIPHETFLTYDGGYNEEYVDFDDGFARCMVFELAALKQTQ